MYTIYIMNTVYKGVAVGVLSLVLVSVFVFFSFQSDPELTIPEGMFLNEQGGVSAENQLVATGDTFDVEYVCEDDSSFMTRYNFGVNTLTVEVDDAEFELEQKVDQVGARYGTRDGAVTFFEAEGVATLTTPDSEFLSCVGSQI